MVKGKPLALRAMAVSDNPRNRPPPTSGDYWMTTDSWTKTRCDRTARLKKYLQLSSPPSTVTLPHPPPTQDQLTCKPLGLSPTDWHGWRWQAMQPTQVFVHVDHANGSGLHGQRNLQESAGTAFISWQTRTTRQAETHRRSMACELFRAESVSGVQKIATSHGVLKNIGP
jgi:hypothetical protein